MDETDHPPGDGRSARRDRNRDAVLDAVIELFSEDVNPSPEEVAVRSGLSPRSVYRYFEDHDGLVRSAIARQLERAIPLFQIARLGEGPLEGRVAAIVDSRVQLHDAVGDTARAARHRAERTGPLADQVRTGRAAMDDQVARQFAPELSALEPALAEQRRDALSLVLQFESLDYLRRDRGLSLEATRETLAGAVGALVR